MIDRDVSNGSDVTTFNVREANDSSQMADHGGFPDLFGREIGLS